MPWHRKKRPDPVAGKFASTDDDDANPEKAATGIYSHPAAERRLSMSRQAILPTPSSVNSGGERLAECLPAVRELKLRAVCIPMVGHVVANNLKCAVKFGR